MRSSPSARRVICCAPVRKPLRRRLAPASQHAVDRRDGSPQEIGCLAGGETEHVAQDQHGTLAGRQVLQRRDECQLDALPLLETGLGSRVAVRDPELLIGVGLDPHGLGEGVGETVAGTRGRPMVDWEHAFRPSCDHVEAGVGRDPVEPRTQRATLLELLQPAPRAEQRVLEGVVGVVDRAQHPVAVRVELTSVGIHEAAKRVTVTLARCFEQLAFPNPRACGGRVHPYTRLDRERLSVSSLRGWRSVSSRAEVVTGDGFNLEIEAAVVTEPAPDRAGRREWIGLAVIALPCAVYAMDLTVLNLALPSLSEELQPSSSQLLWIVDIYGFMVAGLLITMGTLGDRIGRRRLLLIGAGAFGLASALAAASTSAEMLIAARALLGVAGATLAPSTLSLIRNMFQNPQERTFAIGVWITSFSTGAAVGPLIGGLLLERFWWGSVFLPALPVMALLLAVGPRLLPEYRAPEAGRLDLISAATSLVAVLAVIYGLKQIAQDGVGAIACVSIAAGLAVGAAFVRRQRRLADPMIDLSLFRVPAFNAALSANTFGFFVNFGIAVFIAQYLQLVLGLSPFEAGLWTVPYASAFIVGSLLTPVLVASIRPAFVIAGGLALSAAGFALLTLVDGDSSLATLVTGSVVFALGLAPVYTLAADMMVGSAPPERAGAAAGISETSSEFGGALGIAVLGAIGTAVYRAKSTRRSRRASLRRPRRPRATRSEPLSRRATSSRVGSLPSS